jgi:hypothetical protein
MDLSINFDKSQENYLKDLLELAKNKSNYEFEILFNKAKFNSSTSNTNNKISRNQFVSTFERLKKLYGVQTEEPAMLDVSFDTYEQHNKKFRNCRATLYSMPTIQKYCKKNTLPVNTMNVTFLRKKFINDKMNNKIEPANIEQYNLKVNFKEEVEMDADEEIIKDLIANWKKIPKFFRYKKRYTFTTPDGLFRFDLTSVKTSTRINGGKKPQFYINVGDSDVFTNNEEYEIELEYIGNKLGGLTKNVDDIYDNMLKYIYEVLQSVQNISYVISNDKVNEVLNGYLKLVDNRINIEDIYQSLNKHFIGPKVVSLSLSNIRDHGDLFEHKEIINVRKGYCVTEKSDGERCLVYIDKNGDIFILNDRLNVRYTGAKSNNMKNCILDAEHVVKTKTGQNINHILIFDIFFKDGKDVRDVSFKPPSSAIVAHTEDKSKDAKSTGKDDKPKDYGRVGLMNDVFDDLDNEKNDFQFIIKSFKFGSIDKHTPKIFELSGKLWKQITSEDYPYHVDGLIYTPIEPLSNIIKDKDNNKKHNPFYSGTTWNKLLKWKPAQDNTIDFFINIIKEDNGKDRINNILKDGSIRKYKTLILYTGYDDSVHGEHKPTDYIYKKNSLTVNDNNDATYNKKQHSYIKKEFQPHGGNQYTANVFLDTIGGKEMLTTLQKDGEIKSGMIVEMSYDKTQENDWRWKPRNIRYDKMEKARQSGGTNFGNDYEVALNIFDSYSIPITENILFNKCAIPTEYQEKEIYYSVPSNRSGRNTSKTIALQKFHNFIKNMLILSTTNMFDNCSVIDLACGKGGDLHKFYHSKISNYLGIDIVADNINSLVNGSCQRYNKMINDKQTKNVFDAYFIHGNMSENILDGTFCLDPQHTIIWELLFGMNDKLKNDEKIKSQVYNTFSEGVDVVSVQFAIHYSFKEKKMLNKFLTNVEELCRVSGYFIGTCFDGKTTFDLLKKKKKGEYMVGYDNNKNHIWRLKKEYSATTFKDDETSLGLPVSVIMDSIGTENTEYLVNFDYLTNMLELRGLELLNSDECEQFGIPCGDEGKSTGLFSELYDNYLSSGEFGELSSYEKNISFLNRWFIFKKVSNKQDRVKLKVERPKKRAVKKI